MIKLNIRTLQGIGIILTIYLIANLVMYLFGMINHLLFWGTLIAIGFYNWKILPFLRKEAESKK